MNLHTIYHEALKDLLADTLFMSDDDKGAQVLNDLGLKGWCKPEEDELNIPMMLYDRYAEVRSAPVASVALRM